MKIRGKIVDREWIPCSEKMPESEKDVEITYVSKHWDTGEPIYSTARAFYEDGTINTDESSFNWENTDGWEYDEDYDYEIIPEGWFESVTFSEEFEAVDQRVIAWREIGEPYRPDIEDQERDVIRRKDVLDMIDKYVNESNEKDNPSAYGHIVAVSAIIRSKVKRIQRIGIL